MINDLVPQESEILFYTTSDGEVKIDVFFQDETLWLSQKKMAKLFGVETNTINYHLKEIYKSKELSEDSTIRKIRTVQKEGQREVVREIEYYNLDAIIAVGYRVNSHQATQFRIWATQTLRNFVIKGFVLDDERLKNGHHFGKDYFKELLERIRAIRASERRIYQQITDIFAECSIDYNPKSDVTRSFYAMVQNKFHYAITGNTAAEKIFHSADASKPNMGLKTWKKSPAGRIVKSDVVVAKNYLEKAEIQKLERLVSGYFDYLERIVENRVTLKMEDLAESVGKFLEFNEYRVLDGKGEVSHKQAEGKAAVEYEKFKPIQERGLVSDFDRMTKKVLKKS